MDAAVGTIRVGSEELSGASCITCRKIVWILNCYGASVACELTAAAEHGGLMVHRCTVRSSEEEQ